MNCKDVEKSIRFLIPDNIPPFTWEKRKFTVANIEEDDSFVFRKYVYTEDRSTGSVETLSITYQTSRYLIAGHQILKKVRGGKSCDNNHSLKSEAVDTFLHNLHPYTHHAQGV